MGSTSMRCGIWSRCGWILLTVVVAGVLAVPGHAGTQARAITGHPRLFFAAEQIPTLQAQAATTHADIWSPIVDYVKTLVGTAPPVAPPITATPPPPVIHKTLGSKSGVNLLGDLETWGYADNQRLTQASLVINGLSMKDLRDLCTKLPTKIKAELQITVPPDGGQNQ